MRPVVLALALLWPFAVTTPTAHRTGATVAVTGLVALSLTISVGWLRLLTLYQPASVAIGAWACGWALTAGHTLPVAGALGVAAGIVPALAALALCGRRPRLLMPVASLLVTAATVALLSLGGGRPVARPTFVGIDLSGERTVYLVVVLALAAAYRLVVTLREGDVGRRLLAAGWAPSVARLSGVDPAASLRAGVALSGGLAGLAGAATTLVQQAGGDQRGAAVTLAVAYLALPLLGGLWSATGGLWAAAALVLIPRLTEPLGLDMLAVACAGVLAALLLAPTGAPGLAARTQDRWRARALAGRLR
jgi:ABC-type branched-subunit amino acid transport system permease subunit